MVENKAIEIEVSHQISISIALCSTVQNEIDQKLENVPDSF